MKSIKSKIPAIIGTIINILVLINFVVVTDILSLDRGAGLAWVTLDLLLFVLANLLYMADAIISIIKSFMNIDRVFNAILSLVILGTLASFSLLFSSSNLVGEAIFTVWNVLYVSIFALEIISIIKHIKMKRRHNAVFIEQ